MCIALEGRAWQPDRLRAAANTCLLNVWAVSRVQLQHAVHQLRHSRRAGVGQRLDTAAQDVPAQGVVVLPLLQEQACTAVSGFAHHSPIQMPLHLVSAVNAGRLQSLRLGFPFHSSGNDTQSPG